MLQKERKAESSVKTKASFDITQKGVGPPHMLGYSYWPRKLYGIAG